MNYFICMLLIVASFTACKEQPPKETATELEIEKDSELENLHSMMTGSFSNERQATLDTNFRKVTLHMYPIWVEKDGKWLYVEQALTNKQEEPFRQRIYKLSRENDSTLRSDIFTIPNASLWTCKWQTPKFFDRLLPETIEIKEGCEMLLKKTTENTFIGKTV
ncbi:chromophore lyase CpcT/CpeT, partial [uncultured Planktosalinus sp.]|uniref:chromophore lyase CpcT/CpeT n=1 Tax=uncultured Planktosalinus sp. TaxID=1810935 RepID=UPI0030D8D89F